MPKSDFEPTLNVDNLLKTGAVSVPENPGYLFLEKTHDGITETGVYQIGIHASEIGKAILKSSYRVK